MIGKAKAPFDTRLGITSRTTKRNSAAAEGDDFRCGVVLYYYNVAALYNGIEAFLSRTC